MEILDELEQLLISAALPLAEQLKKEMNLDDEPNELARNLIGKIGTRILFGSDLFDKAFKN